MICRDCVHFHKASEKFTLGRDHVVFKCPQTKQQSFAQWDLSCLHFRPSRPDDAQEGDDASGSPAVATS
jgi:hypothetical protein